MILIVLLALTGASLAQYPQQVAPSPPYQNYQHESQPQGYAHQQPAYQPQPQQRQRVFNPAAVHYVNIGAQLQGDYKFGYDTGKGDAGQSFREETRLPDGSVRGAYGYIDDTGKQRIVKYTAGKDGYRVDGDGINPSGAPQPVANPHAAQAPPAGYSSQAPAGYPNTNYVGNGYQQYSG